MGRHRARDSRGAPPSHGTHAASPRGRGAGLPPPGRGIPGDLGKGWWFLRDPEPSHQGLTACPQSPSACGALPSLGSGESKQRQVFTLASWKKPGPSSESPARAASRPCHGRGTRTCSRCHAWPLPCSPVSVGPLVQLPTAGEAGVLLCWVGASTRSPAGSAPEEGVATPGPVPAPRWAVGSMRLGGARRRQPCSHPHTRGWRRGVTMGDCGTRPRAQPGHGGTEWGQPQDQPLGLAPAGAGFDMGAGMEGGWQRHPALGGRQGCQDHPPRWRHRRGGGWGYSRASRGPARGLVPRVPGPCRGSGPEAVEPPWSLPCPPPLQSGLVSSPGRRGPGLGQGGVARMNLLPAALAHAAPRASTQA